jgi:hypothetical protein
MSGTVTMCLFRSTGVSKLQSFSRRLKSLLDNNLYPEGLKSLKLQPKPKLQALNPYFVMVCVVG